MRKITDKKGLSNIIATVLIVLLALAAIAIIWGFLRKPLETTGESIDLASKCFLVEVEPTGCQTGDTNTTSNVTVQLLSGEAHEITYSIKDSTGFTLANRTSATGLQELGSVSFTNIDTTSLDSDASQWVVEAAAVVADETGVETLTCDVSTETVGCKNGG
jgi:hypothetical protein